MIDPAVNDAQRDKESKPTSSATSVEPFREPLPLIMSSRLSRKSSEMDAKGVKPGT